jgi:hypothetical protein
VKKVARAPDSAKSERIVSTLRSTRQGMRSQSARAMWGASADTWK